MEELGSSVTAQGDRSALRGAEDGSEGLEQLQACWDVSALGSALPSALHGGLSQSCMGVCACCSHGDKLVSCSMAQCWDTHPGQTFVVPPEFFPLGSAQV